MCGIVGIVAEYNPFHNGHKYQIDFIKNKGADGIVACMSGACVQRGQFAMLSKFDRAQAALCGGVDAVLELPVPFSIKSAEGFAKAGIETLKNAGVDGVSFGCECDDVALLSHIAEYLLTDEYSNKIKVYLAEKMPFAKAREKAVTDAIPQSYAVLSQSNNILAIEYLKACRRLNWEPQIIAVKRQGGAYNSDSLNNKYPSASAIRRAVDRFDYESVKNAVPPESNNILSTCLDRGKYFSESDISYEKLLLYKLRTSNVNALLQIPECNTEIAHCIERRVYDSDSLSRFFDLMPTKRYTRARINRILLSLLLGINNDMPCEIQYLRLLGVNKEKEYLLNHIAKSSALPVSHSVKKLSEINGKCKAVVDAEALACDIQSAFFKISGNARTDYTTKLIKK